MWEQRVKKECRKGDLLRRGSELQGNPIEITALDLVDCIGCLSKLVSELPTVIHRTSLPLFFTRY